MNVGSAFRTYYNDQEHLLMIQASFWLKEVLEPVLERKRVDWTALDIIFAQFLEMYSVHFPEEADELGTLHDSYISEDKELLFYNDLLDEFAEVEINPIQNENS